MRWEWIAKAVLDSPSAVIGDVQHEDAEARDICYVYKRIRTTVALLSHIHDLEIYIKDDLEVCGTM